MKRKAFQTCLAVVATALGLLLSGSAEAQSPPTVNLGDWPNLGAYNNRQGQNGDPTNQGSGITELRWGLPFSTVPFTTITLDNTSFADTRDTTRFPGGPYEQNPLGRVSNAFPNVNAWPAPTDSSKEASMPFLMPRRLAQLGVLPPDPSPRSPAYYYATCTPMAKGQSDPTVAQTPANLKYFEWTFKPQANLQRTYALYAYLPVGATDVSAAGGAQDRRFPQRYFVYEIRFGNGFRYVDVVDTAIAGTGWVRLGNNGLATDRVFPYDGTNAIIVRLYNTVPRNDDGSLKLTGATSNMTTAQEDLLSQQSLVYADGARARPNLGTFLASPTTATFQAGTPALYDWQVALAGNQYVVGVLNGQYTQAAKGVVNSYVANPALWTAATVPLQKWRYSPVEESPNGNTTDNNSAGVTASPLFTSSTTNPNHLGTDYFSAPATTATTPGGTVTYAPSLPDGTYDLYAYIPGNSGTDIYGRAVVYQVYEGTTLIFQGTIDQSAAQGWVRIGTRAYTNTRDALPNAPLSVVLTNRSTNAGDTGRKIYADAIRFVSAATIGISSTPVHATVRILQPGGGLVDTKVTLVADESGRIHCLDFRGNGDGTTTEYWSYPSTPDYTDPNWVDPNLSIIVSGSGDLASGVDGKVSPTITPPRDNAPTATMPTSFDLSTAAIARIGTDDILYIAATNGRVYAINMAGRGDFNKATHKIGTTRRQWTFPNDYDPTHPNNTIAASALGSFRGSIVFGDTPQGAPGPTIYVPAPQGRVYALNAVGDPTTTTTAIRWQYPAATDSTLSPILMTPTLQFNRLYFGTDRNPNNDGPGQFFSLDAGTGSVVWMFDGTATDSNPGVVGPKDSDGNPADPSTEDVGGWITGPVAVSAARLAEVPSPYTVNTVDTVYALNQNTYLYGFNAATGQIVTGANHALRTRDLNSLSSQNLTYTVISAYDRTNIRRQFPVVVVPGSTGLFQYAFARPEDYNAYDGFNAGGYQFGSGLKSAAATNGYLMTADEEGFFYALDNVGAAGGNLPIGLFPDPTQLIPPNDPRGLPFRNLHILLMNKLGYLKLREVNTDGTGGLTYDEAVNQTTYHAANPPAGQSTFAFEWGQTAYIMVYGFPYATQNLNGDTIAPPQVNLTLMVEGKVVRQLQVDSRQFKNPGSSPPVEQQPSGGNYLQDAYAIVPFTFQGGGPNSLPPGNGSISATVTTAALGTSATSQPVEILPDTRTAGGGRVPFIMANPLALVVFDSPDSPLNHGIGNTVDPYNQGSIVNGSPDLGGTTENESHLQASAGYANNGSTATAHVYVIDRSLMALIRPEGRSIENLRVQRTNLQWQGGATTIFKRLLPGLYPNFEDSPVNFPNTSLDYPNVGRDSVRAVKDPNGAAENPVLSPVSLLPPLGGTTNKQLTEDDDPLNRLMQPTPIDMAIDIPRYQPPVDIGAAGLSDSISDNDLLRKKNSAGIVLPQGYFGRVWAFVDSTGDSKLNTDTREAYRSFSLSVGVLPQTSILMGVPNVDLGSLSAGTGYGPFNPGNDPTNSKYNPWTGAWGDSYKEFSVRNDGNVNLLAVRLAKAGQSTANPYPVYPWGLYSADNDPLGYLSAVFNEKASGQVRSDLWSNIDATFAVPNTHEGGRNLVILPKPRVTDPGPTELQANPVPRANPNTGATGRAPDFILNPAFPQSAPKVAVSIPIGFPVGTYSSEVQAIEEDMDTTTRTITGSEVLNYFPGTNTLEAYSNPMTLTFKVAETRMTNDHSPKTANVFDGSLAPNTTNRAAYRNVAPAAMRDAFGSLVVAWESDRPIAHPAGAPSVPNGPTRLYFASLDNAATFSGSGIDAPVGNSPLWDLNQFVPAAADTWFKTVNPNGFPATPTDLFPGMVAGTERFGDPALPVRGQVNPLNSVPFVPANNFRSSVLGFVGEAQVGTATGRFSQSKVFVTTVSPDANGGLSIGSIYETNDDPLTVKGKPSVLQLSTGALVFYPATSAGQTSIHVSRFNSNLNGFTRAVALNFGRGFSSVFSPSASARRYTGLGSNGEAMVELSFAGKLRGRANAEVYLGRMRLGTTASDSSLQLLDGQGNSIETDRAGSPFVTMPTQTLERLLPEGNNTFRARGVNWVLGGSSMPSLVQVNGAQSVDLMVNPTIDRQSGLIVADSRLGGKVYLDPELGTVRFVGGTPSPNFELRLTYTPTFLRVTEGSKSGYSGVNALYDDRYISDYSYWFRPDGSAVQPADNVQSDRYLFAYTRGAIGNVTQRPYTTTMRLGLRLPTRIATKDDGTIVGLSVSGATRPYQVDPASGRVYFQAEDENRPVTVNYVGASEATNAPTSFTVTGTVSFVLERGEAQIGINEAANEGSLTAFLDPFTFPSDASNDRRRPPLTWLFYVSTRGGSPDVFFQTIAPRYTPFAK